MFDAFFREIGEFFGPWPWGGNAQPNKLHLRCSLSVKLEEQAKKFWVIQRIHAHGVYTYLPI